MQHTEQQSASIVCLERMHMLRQGNASSALVDTIAQPQLIAPLVWLEKQHPLDQRIAPIVQLEAMQLPRHQSAPSVLVDTIAHFYQQREQWISPRAALENMPPLDQRRASFVLVEVIQQQVQHSAPIVPLDGIVRKKQREAPHVPLVWLEHIRVL